MVECGYPIARRECLVILRAQRGPNSPQYSATNNRPAGSSAASVRITCRYGNPRKVTVPDFTMIAETLGA